MKNIDGPQQNWGSVIWMDFLAKLFWPIFLNKIFELVVQKY